MNIKSFISNIFSSQKKDRKAVQNDAPLTPLASRNQTNDEYLLSNLRKSKLFLDDMEVGNQQRETDQNQAVQDAEKYVGLIPSSSQENLASKRYSKNQPTSEYMTNSVKKRLSEETISEFFERTNSVADNAFIAEAKPRTNGGFFNQSENHQRMEYVSQNGESNPQKLMTALTFGEDLPLNRSRIHEGNDSSKMPEEHEILKDEQSEKGFFQNSSQSSNSTNAKRSSSMSSRVRGSSSKKKSITLAESPQAQKNLRVSRVPDLQVNEDIEGENDQQAAGTAANLRNQCPPQSPSCIERQDSQDIGILTSSQKERQMECLSTRAEPPTQAKHRQNSFFFDASAEKLQLNEYNQGARAASSKHSSASSKNSMSIESSSSSRKLSGSNNVSAFNKEHLPQESRSAGSSPGRASLLALHKQIDMMIDKSEIPPPHLIRSNHKVPSPIKEVDELSQIHGNKHSSKDSVKQKLSLDEFNSNNGLIERQPIQESEEDGSPKMRQKSVKFENSKALISPLEGNIKKSGKDTEGDDVEDDCGSLSEIDQPKHHNLKLQSRKPTPYNPAKQTPQSYLSRLKKFHPQEPLDISRPLFPKGQECEDVEKDVNIHQDVNSYSKNTSSSSSRNKVISQSKTVITGEKINEQGFNNIFSQKSTKQQNPPLNMQTKKPVKLPLAIKPKDVVNSQIKTYNSNHKSNISAVNHSTPFFRSDPSHSTPLPISTQAKAKSANEKTSNGSGENSNNYRNSSNNRKRKMTSEEDIQVGFARKIKVAQEHSLSVPKKATATDGNFHGNITSSFGPKSAYKTCVFCENDIKPKDETKTFACCHKAHKTCMAKEKNPVCSKCNSTIVNKIKNS